CHPFYTGKQKLVDSARRVEKFKAKVDAQKEVAKTRKGKTVKRAAKTRARIKEEIIVKPGSNIKKISKKKASKK
ncbi:MAG: 50S ribosomal protein L31, partial [Patescibacteria group bacterium]